MGKLEHCDWQWDVSHRFSGFFKTDIFAAVHSWSKYKVSFSAIILRFRVWRKSSIAKQYWPHLRRQTEIFSDRWGSLCHATPHFLPESWKAGVVAYTSRQLMLSCKGRGDSCSTLSDRWWCLSGVSSNLAVWTQRFHLTDLSLKSLAIICRGYNSYLPTHSHQPKQRVAFPLFRLTNTPGPQIWFSASRDTSLQQEEATQSHGGRYFKSMLLVLLLFLDQKSQLHKDTASSLGAGLQTLPAKCSVQFHCAKGHLCLGSVGNSLRESMGIVLGTVNNL